MAKVLFELDLELQGRVLEHWLNPAKFRVKSPPPRPSVCGVQAVGEEIDGRLHCDAINLNSLTQFNPDIFRTDILQKLEDAFDGQTCPSPDIECSNAFWVYPWDLEALLTNGQLWD